jgi:hypothetical protein
LRKGDSLSSTSLIFGKSMSMTCTSSPPASAAC